MRKTSLAEKRGFTLIELLVVISIIGLLSSLVLAGVNSARIKARDSKRIHDLNQIRIAIDLYYDKYGYYPATPCGWDCTVNSYYTSATPGWTSESGLGLALAEFIPKLPVDPLNNGGGGPWNGANTYSYGNVGRDVYRVQYDLTASLEDTKSPFRCGVRNYKWYYSNSPWCVAFGGMYHNQLYEASNI